MFRIIDSLGGITSSVFSAAYYSQCTDQNYLASVNWLLFQFFAGFVPNGPYLGKVLLKNIVLVSVGFSRAELLIIMPIIWRKIEMRFNSTKWRI